MTAPDWKNSKQATVFSAGITGSGMFPVDPVEGEFGLR
jgi:hypothetical protein